MIVLQVLTGTFLIAGVELVEAAAQTADDDQVINAGKQLQQIPMGLVVVMIVVQIALHCVGVQGAITYTKWMVYCALASYALNFVVNVFQMNIFGLVLNVTLAYPHFYFIHEINQNIMSKLLELRARTSLLVLAQKDFRDLFSHHLTFFFLFTHDSPRKLPQRSPKLLLCLRPSLVAKSNCAGS
jgi:hypothetical protein